MKTVKHQNRMPRGAVTSPSSNLPGQGPRLPNITFRVTYALGRRMKKEGPKVLSSPNLSVVLWMACFQHSSDEQTGRNVRDSSVPELPQITHAFVTVVFVTVQPELCLKYQCLILSLSNRCFCSLLICQHVSQLLFPH